MLQQKTALEKLMDERKSVRKYEPGVTIPREQIQHILEQATSAPSSSNLQPWRFLVIDDQDKRKNYALLDLIRRKLKHHQRLLLY